jgi:hypothetical protein
MRYVWAFCFLIFALQVAAQKKQTVIEGKTFQEGFELLNQKNVLIRNCNFSNRSGRFGLKISNCENVTVEDCTVSGVGNEGFSKYITDGLLPTDSSDYPVRKGDFRAIGIHVADSRLVTIKKCRVQDVFGQGIKLGGASHLTAGQIKIDSCRIAYVYDDGIKVEVRNDQVLVDSVLPMQGVEITNNMIHDIGLGVTQLPYARHGMYVKARDALIEGNTIYNCFYGEGISLRNAGVVRANKVWNCYIGCIGFWAQTNTTGSSRAVVIEDNICRQDYNLDLAMRHIDFPEREPVIKYNVIQWAFADKERVKAKIEKFVIRNNVCIAGADFRTSHAMVALFGEQGKDQVLVYEGNELIDRNGGNKQFTYVSSGSNPVKK